MRRLVPVVTLALAGLVPFLPSQGATAAEVAGPLMGGPDGRECLLIDTSVSDDTTVNTPVGNSPCSGVRPGARVTTPAGGCSLNFLFLGSDGARYIGTAGHCIVGSGVETTWPSGTGPVARVDGQEAGRFVYAVLNGVEDFALIKIHSHVAASPSMCHFGGPTGLYTGMSTTPVTVHHYGYGTVISQVLRARSGVSPFIVNEPAFNFFGAVIFGDSGSGAIDAEGRALGTIVSLGASPAGTNRVTRTPFQVERARQVLGLASLTLQTAPLTNLLPPS